MCSIIRWSDHLTRLRGGAIGTVLQFSRDEIGHVDLVTRLEKVELPSNNSSDQSTLNTHGLVFSENFQIGEILRRRKRKAKR